MFIKRLKPNVYDVFVGNGWSQWARVERRGAELQQVGGSFKLNTASFNQVKARIMR